MKRIVGIGVLIVALAATFGIWRCRGERPGSVGTRTTVASPAVRGSSGAPAVDAPLPAWFTVRGAPARRIAGRVFLDDQPLANAVVTLHTMLTHAGFGAPVVVRSAADGAFDFGMRPPSQYAVAATSDGATGGFVNLDLSDPAAQPDRIELRLTTCTIFIAGTVSDAAHNSLANVRVAREGHIATTTDAQGRYKLCVPFGDAPIEYTADGYGGVVLTIDARGETRRDVVLVPEAAVEVRVVHAEDATPVTEAHVYVFPSQWGPDRALVRSGITDAEGRVRIAGLVPGRYRVNGFADGLASTTVEETHAQVGVPAEVTLRLHAMAQIHGRVVAGGQPLGGVRMMASRKSPAGRSAHAFSQADGTFVLERVPPGEVAFIATTYDVVAPTAFVAKVGARNDVVVEVRGLGVIRGTVTRLGKPAVGVEVCCVQTPTTLQGPTAISDRDGKYAFRGVPAGGYDIAAGSDEIGAFVPGRKITLGDAEDKVVDLEMDQAGTIAGTVVDKAGKPVAGVFVRWLHEKTGDVGRSTTDAKGRYRCGAMTGGGRYRAAVFPSMQLQQISYPTADGAPYPALEVKDATTVIEDVVLKIDRPDLVIAGRVVDETSRGIADAIVKALPSAGGPPLFHPWLRLPMTSTDDTGAFRLTGLPPGNFALSARSADGAEGVAPQIAAGTQSAIVRVERAGTIDGKLVGFAQPPVVYARPVAATTFTAGSVTGAASFRLIGLRPGRYVVNAQTTYEGDAATVDIKPGETITLTLTAQGRGTVEGTVLDFRTRAPVPNAMCHAVMAVDGEQTLTNWDPSTAPRSAADGTFRLEPAPAGSIDVNCEMASHRWSRPSTAITLAPGATAKAVLLSAELAQENGAGIGIGFDGRTTPPRIASVEPAAAKVGFLVGDLVTHVDDVSVTGLNGAGVGFLIASKSIGEVVKLRVLRGTQAKTLIANVIGD